MQIARAVSSVETESTRKGWSRLIIPSRHKLLPLIGSNAIIGASLRQLTMKGSRKSATSFASLRPKPTSSAGKAPFVRVGRMDGIAAAARLVFADMGLTYSGQSRSHGFLPL